jgi:hypothetical protein
MAPRGLPVAEIISGVADVHRSAGQELAGLEDHHGITDAEWTRVQPDDDCVYATRTD